ALFLRRTKGTAFCGEPCAQRVARKRRPGLERRARAGAKRLADFSDVRCLKTLRAAGHLELDLVTFCQGLETLGLDGAVVDEYVLAALLRDESVPFRVVEPLDLSLCHPATSLFGGLQPQYAPALMAGLPA